MPVSYTHLDVYKRQLDTLIPKVGVITDIREETPDVKTFRVNAPEGGKLFEHMPGQCAICLLYTSR